MVCREIFAFGHPYIRNHPNVAQLQGLCWDISTDSKVWPVLVFEKSPLGDFHDFLESPVGRNLDAARSLKLCLDVGTAIMDLHAVGKQVVIR